MVLPTPAVSEEKLASQWTSRWSLAAPDGAGGLVVADGWLVVAGGAMLALVLLLAVELVPLPDEHAARANAAAPAVTVMVRFMVAPF